MQIEDRCAPWKISYTAQNPVLQALQFQQMGFCRVGRPISFTLITCRSGPPEDTIYRSSIVVSMTYCLGMAVALQLNYLSLPNNRRFSQRISKPSPIWRMCVTLHAICKHTSYHAHIPVASYYIRAQTHNEWEHTPLKGNVIFRASM
jgi:hypothetical protein